MIGWLVSALVDWLVCRVVDLLIDWLIGRLVLFNWLCEHLFGLRTGWVGLHLHAVQGRPEVQQDTSRGLQGSCLARQLVHHRKTLGGICEQRGCVVLDVLIAERLCGLEYCRVRW